MSSALRRKELETNIKDLKEAYLGADTVVKTFRWDSDERSLSIRLVIDEETFRFSVYIPEDFPDMRPMVSIDGDDDDELTPVVEKTSTYAEKPTASIGSIVHQLLTEMAKIREFRVPKVGGLALSSAKPKRNLKESMEDEEPEDDEYYDEDEGGHNEVSRLVKHSQIAQQLFGADTVLVYPFIDTVRLQLPTSSLAPDLKERLGLNSLYHSHVVVSIQFGSGDYLYDRRIPQVKALHPKEQGSPDRDVRSGLGEQVENIARQFLERVWPSLHCEAAERVMSKLQAMGFDEDYCIVALDKHNYELDAAMSFLTEGIPLLKGEAHVPTTPAPKPSDGGGKKKDGWFGFGTAKKDKGKGRDTSGGAGSNSSSTSSTSSSSPATTIEQQRLLVTRDIVDLEDLISKGYNELAMAHALYYNRMHIPNAVRAFAGAKGQLEDYGALATDSRPELLERNLVVELTCYLLRRIQRPIGYCLICDKPIINKSQVSPTICTVGTCQFNYIELGVCSSIPVSFCPTSIADDIMNNPDIVDLYISMAVASGTSARKNDIFNPFPPMFESSGTKDFTGVVSVLMKIPSVDDMRKHCTSERQLVRFLNSHDSTGSVYELLTWLLSINRAALLKMPPTLHIEQMKTKHQYMMTAGTDPDKAAKFKAWRKEYGSYFAFHGSSIENWHSILRVGLLNLSGTKLMTTGQAYGPGVYLAPDSGTSMGYARTGAAWSKSKFGDSSLVCLAIAEVVKHPEAPHTANPYYVVRNADYVATRFFLFYPGGNSSLQLQAASLDLSKYV
eukprot:TRINITY_DN7973_c0_g1_i1.p1 TRINITY_DN7973_c0_g1~~TRINITY_DN7973_c0_g1_i1.p1  ORF type:complete len:784 (+),score=143.95 TRINITY_DN7973_c0_g1_i1:56-2407(+)